MRIGNYALDLEDHGLCHGAQNRVHIQLGDNGYSVCRSDHPFIGDCLFEGIQDLSIAQELTEMLLGELENKMLLAQRNPCLVFG
ncbi:MAG: hypothetical protein HQL96_05855 [Magnetococcales bacterium]|nr:hypothetical protein [Magnetococcales bacterium]